ncbi:plasmid mobilization relaxosome protein MobC [Streptomyces griseus]|uniref:plasmid mobilization relaxosome protein MobC n=1 Tax=Streptomyces griseus TaxID=1911 RepID=UPI003688D35C
MPVGGYVAETSLATARADDPTAAVADYRDMVKALMAANALTWRIHRLGQRHAPGPLAQAAVARSTTRLPATPVHPPAATPTAVQQPQVRRR